MKHRQAVYRTLPPRQTSHALFVGEIVGKYSGMQRNAGKLPLTHRLAASSDHRKRMSIPKPSPLQVQIVLPNPAPGPVRVIERERPVYRDRIVTAVQPTNLETAKPSRSDAPEPPKERVIEREKIIERDRIVERKEIVERERVVEKKVVIVREVERIIREQRILREQAVMLPIRESEGARPVSDVQPRRRRQDGPFVHPNHPTQPDRLNHGDERRTDTEPLTGSIGHSKVEPATSSDRAQVRQAGSTERSEQTLQPRQADQPRQGQSIQGQSRETEQSIRSRRSGQPALLGNIDNSVQTSQEEQTNHAVQSSPSATTGHPDATSSDFRALVQGDLSAELAMRRQSWPLHIAKKSGWRTPQERVQQEKNKPQPRTKRDRRNKKKKRDKTQTQTQTQTSRAVNAKPSLPGITLINRKMRRSDGMSGQSKWRLSSAMPSPLRENRPGVRQAPPGTAPKQADFDTPVVNHENTNSESGTRDWPVVAGRAVIADPLRIRKDKPAQYRIVQAAERSASPLEPNGRNLSGQSFTVLAHLLRNGNRGQEGTTAKPAFLQGKALQRHTIPLTWSSRPARSIAAQSVAQSPSPQDAQSKYESFASAQNGKQGRAKTTQSFPTGKGDSVADSGQRWSSLRPVHIRNRMLPAMNQPLTELRAHIDMNAVGKPESPGFETQAAVRDKAASAAMQDVESAKSDQDMTSSVSLQNAERTVIGPDAETAPIVQDEGTAEIVQAKLMRSGQPERAPTVHIRQQSRGTSDDNLQVVKGTIKRNQTETIARHEQNPTERSDMPIAKFVASGPTRAADGSSVRKAEDTQAGALLQERGMQKASRPSKPRISLSHALRTQSNRYSSEVDRSANSAAMPPSDAAASGSGGRGTSARDANPPGSIIRGMTAPDSIARETIARGANLPSSIVRGTMVRGVNGTGSNVRETIARGANEPGLIVRGTMVRGANEPSSIVHGTLARGANAPGSNVRGTIARGANAPGSIVHGTIVRGANAPGSNVRGTMVRGANEPGSIVRETMAQGANSPGSIVRGTMAQDTNEPGSNVRGTMAQGANAPGSNVRGMMARDASEPGSNVRGTMARNANEPGSTARGTMVRDANLPSLIVRGTMVRDANEPGSNVRGIIARGTVAPGPILRRKIARDANEPGSNVRGTMARGANLPSLIVRGTMAQGANEPGSNGQGAIMPSSIVQRVRAQRSNAEASRRHGADSQIQHSSAPGTHGLIGSGTNAQVQTEAGIGRNAQQSIPLVNAAQADSVQQRDVPSRGTALWRDSRADRQQRADYPEQGTRPRITSASVIVQRRQALPLPRHSRAAVSEQQSLPRHSQAGRHPALQQRQSRRQLASQQSAAAIAMQPSASMFGAASATAMLQQSAPAADKILPGITLAARSNAASAASVQAQIAHRGLSANPRAPAGTIVPWQQAALSHTQILAVQQQSGPAATDAAFAAIPLAYASSQAGGAAANAGHGPPGAAIPGSTTAPPMEFRRQQAPPAAPPPEASASPSAVKSAIDPEQLQQAISKLPMLNPDQIADQVYKALAKRMKFEQRLQGY